MLVSVIVDARIERSPSVSMSPPLALVMVR